MLSYDYSQHVSLKFGDFSGKKEAVKAFCTIFIIISSERIHIHVFEQVQVEFCDIMPNGSTINSILYHFHYCVTRKCTKLCFELNSEFDGYSETECQEVAEESEMAKSLNC